MLFVENSIGLSGSTLSLATLLTHLDREAYHPNVAVSRREQRDFLRQQVGEDVAIEVVTERTSLARSDRGARVVAGARARAPRLHRPLLWLIAVLDLFYSTLPYALRLARLGRRCHATLLHQNNGFDLGSLLAG